MKKGSTHSPETLTKLLQVNRRSGLARRGIPHTAEHNRKVSEANKGQIPWIKGRKQTSQHIEKRVQARIQNGTTPKVTAPRGKRHYLWIADRSKLSTGDKHERGSAAHREWSSSVKRRDGWKCRISNQDCEGKVIAHHIHVWRDYPGLRYQIKNGITLCHFHHPRTRSDEKRMSPVFLAMVANTV
jgi:NUMOD3 motif